MRLPWWFAALQVVLICGVPTQLIVFAALVGAGTPMGADGSLFTLDPTKISLQFFASLSLFDTALVALLIRVFLALSGESSNDVFIGGRSIAREFVRGLVLLPLLWFGVAGLIALLGRVYPTLHNVPQNPLGVYMDTPMKAAIFIVVVILAGGIREELQRAFILHRFEQRLGGAYVGLAIFSVAFGLLHLEQGFDVAIAVGTLGLLWGLIYLRRRSVVAPMVSHAGFDVAQVLGQLLLKTLVR